MNAFGEERFRQSARLGLSQNHFEMQRSRQWTWASTGMIICARLFPEQGNSLPHVARLIDEYVIKALDDRVLVKACKLGASPSDLDFVLSRTNPDWRKVVTSAAKGGHLHVFQWMVERQDGCGPWEPDFSYAMEEAAACGHLELIKWLHERGIDSFHGCIALDKAIAHGHLAMVQWLLQEGVELSLYRQQHLKQAARDGHLETVHWIHENIKHADTSHAMEGAARSGDLDLLQWLHQLKPCPESCSAYVMDAAVIGGHFRVVEWLFANCSKGCSRDAVRKTVKAGDLPMLQWLHKHYSDRFNSNTADLAAWEGHLEMAKWLHDLGSERCSPFATDAAADGGHFEVVRWLHEIRIEGWTTEAMDYAARGGHLEIVKWLHANRSEGCSKAAMRDAARNGHVDVLQWLVEHYPDKCEDNLTEVAAWEGHLDVVQFLEENTKQRASGWGLGAAMRQGRLATLLVLVRNYWYPLFGEAGRLDSVGKAFNEILTQLSNQHATPKSPLWKEALGSLESFHRCGFYSCVSRMLDQALQRGFMFLVQQLMENRDSNVKREYVSAAAKSRSVVFLRWMLRNGTPIDRSSAIQLATKHSSVEYMYAYLDYLDVAGYLCERDRVQVVCKAITKDKWRRLLRWMLKNTSFNDESSRATIDNALKQASSSTVKWLRENLTNTEARKWCI